MLITRGKVPNLRSLKLADIDIFHLQILFLMKANSLDWIFYTSLTLEIQSIL